MPTHLSKYKNYYEAFTALFGELNFDAVDGGLSYDTQDLLYGLLEFNPDHRLGYNANTMQHGHDTLMNHAFFKNIDWALLESKQVPPPYIPTNEILECMCTTNNTPKTLPELLISANKSHWCEEFKSPDDLSCIETHPSSIIVTTNNNNKVNNNVDNISQYCKRSRNRMIISPADQIYFNKWSYVQSEFASYEYCNVSNNNASNASSNNNALANNNNNASNNNGDNNVDTNISAND